MNKVNGGSNRKQSKTKRQLVRAKKEVTDDHGVGQPVTGLDIAAFLIAAYQILLPFVFAFITVILLVFLLVRLAV
ncbi:hypothetical protein [Calderihabitans maritimus]|uniref:Uncharacterized protein n=1 Tax=Calderihabitans maritimus TaxID=1246530 RepID=A0A1Z5HTJ9_9FIRM|nr:hypothetical protein [Calderihabitans maritimus]GAW92866.1 hypothetical protein KKC1_20140 [Calderihabitans maritimus]